MISANDIDTLLGEDYEDNPRFQQVGWGKSKGDWEPVEYDETELVYYLTDEGWSVRIDNVGTFERIEQGGVFHDGGTVHHVIRFTDEEGNSKDFMREGRYSSWDSTDFGRWFEAESYQVLETYWRAKR